MVITIRANQIKWTSWNVNITFDISQSESHEKNEKVNGELMENIESFKL